MGDEDHIEVGRDVPREIGSLGDGVVLVGRLGHGIILSGAGLWCWTRHDCNRQQERQAGWPILTERWVTETCCRTKKAEAELSHYPRMGVQAGVA
jgi:hypothetical protein